MELKLAMEEKDGWKAAISESYGMTEEEWTTGVGDDCHGGALWKTIKKEWGAGYKKNHIFAWAMERILDSGLINGVMVCHLLKDTVYYSG